MALVAMGARTGRVPARVCANPMWTGYTLFNDFVFADHDDLRSTVHGQLDDMEAAPATERVRIDPAGRGAARRWEDGQL
ncbi:hypothetical protein [Streptomyces sp. NPDC102282]|uniref:hypothetical protein n=1 Tax=Streptomyces sp. NPDC102282 TaxID=3366154 RepID=UPI00382DD074